METTNNKMTDPLLDAAVAEGDDPRLDRQLRETVARMAAASPYMSPPADLRGRILQATAPATFRMEDYRRATSERSRFYRWGFYAALFFLMAGAWYNISLQGSLKSATQQVAAANQQVGAIAQQGQQRDAALASMMNPSSDQITLFQNGKITGKAYVDDKTNRAIVVLPEGLLPPDQGIHFSLNKNGKIVAYDTIVLAASRDFFPDAAAKLGTSFGIKDLQPDAAPKTVFDANLYP